MRKAALLLGGVLALATAACNNNGAGGDASEIEETANGVTQYPPPGTNMNSVVAAASDSPTPTDAPNYTLKAGMSDLYEIQAGRLAEQKAESPAMKAFGRQMVADHTATSANVKKAVAEAGLNLVAPATLDPKHKGLIDALNAASGPAFDSLYRQQQLTAHQEALALHQSYAANGDTPQLKAVAAATAPKVQAHLEMLRTMQ